MSAYSRVYTLIIAIYANAISMMSFVVVVGIRINQVGVAVLQDVTDQALPIFLLGLIRLVKVLVVVQQDLFI